MEHFWGNILFTVGVERRQAIIQPTVKSGSFLRCLFVS